MKKFAIHIHVFYPDLWPEIAECLKNFPACESDIFITAVESDKDLFIKIKSEFPQSHINIVENRGYDLGPFIETINRLDLSQYQYIVKLHTKRNWNGWFNSTYVRGDTWRRWLLEFCSSKDALSKCLETFDNAPAVGVVTSPDVIVTHGDYLERKMVKSEAESILRKCNLQPSRRAFIGGTMFIMRSKLLKPIQGLNQISDFSPVKSHELGTLAHVYERVLGYAVTAQGYHFATIRKSRLILPRLWFIIVPTYKILLFIRNQMPDRQRERRNGASQCIN